MTQNQEAARPVETIARRVREVRRRRGWSAAQLAERMRQTGIGWDRNIVANLETGRRASVGVDELLALAHVLGVAPVHLLVPLDDKAPYQITPTVTYPAEDVRYWVNGDLALYDPDDPDHDDDWRSYHTEVPTSELRRSVEPGSRRGPPEPREEDQPDG